MNINKYIKQQDELVTAFTDGLTNSIGNSLSRKQDNLSLIISNQLTKLWNDSWNLGRTHAIDETPPSLFSYGNYIAEFASPLEKLRSEMDAITKEMEGYQSELNRMKDDYQDTAGNYSGTKILRSIKKKGKYTDVEKVKAIQTIVNRENELLNLIQAKDNLLKVKQDEFFELTDPANIAKLNELSKVSKDTTPEVNTVKLPRVNTTEVKQELDSASKRRDAWNKTFVDDKGNFNVALYRKRRGFDNDVSDEVVEKQMRLESNDLNNEVNSRIQTLREAKPRKGISNKEQRLIERTLRKQQNLQTSKLDASKIPAYIRDTVQAIESRRQIESTRGDVPLLKQTEFGKSYLNRRINTITNDLNERYKATLQQILVGDKDTKTVGYLEDNRTNKDVTYYKRISAMLTREDAKQMEQYNKQLELINDKLGQLLTKQEAMDFNPYKRQEILNSKYNPEVPLNPGNKKLLNELPDKAVYTREDIKSYRDKLLEKVRKLKDNQARTKRIAITEMGHAYNLGRLDYYINKNIKFVKWNNSIEHKRQLMIPRDYHTRYQKIYNTLSELINRSPQLESFKMDGIVCPICQERAIYDYGYGKGIIKIDDLLTNVQTQPLLHANCFPAGTEVSGIIPKTATRRHYQGNMIIIETASGLKLTVTPKHPILTNNGWISADRIVNGTYVFSAQNTNRLKTFIAPDYYQVPTLIEQVFATFRKSSGSTTCTVPISTEDFHGDFGIGSEVDIVHTNSFLRSSFNTDIAKIITQDFFVNTAKSTFSFNSQSFFNQFDFSSFSTFTRNISVNNFPVNFFLSQSRSKQYRSILDVSNLDIVSSEDSVNCTSRNLKFFGNMINRFSRIEHLANSIGIDGIFSLTKAIYTPFFKSSVNSINTNSEILCNLFSGNSPVILPDQVVNIVNFYFSGHVYNLETVENWYTANSIIVHNCACFLTAVDTQDVNETFNVPIYISSLLNNNVVKWATAGILGTAAMYAAFKKSNLTPLNIPDIIRSKPAVVTTKALTQALLDDVPVIDVPLVPLRIPELVPPTVNIDSATEVLEDVVNWHTNTIDESISKAVDIDANYELVNPYIIPNTKQKVDDIIARVKEYKAITKATLTKDRLNQFKEDVDKIQFYINEIEDANTKIYSSIQSMKLARKAVIDEGSNVLYDDVIPPGFTPEQVIISYPIIQRLDNQILQSENALRNAIALKLGDTSHYSTLQRIRTDLLDNELFKLEYTKRKRGVLLRLQRNLTKQVNPRVLERDLEELKNTILLNYMNVTNEQFESYVRRLDNIELAIDGQLELIKNKLGLTSLDARNYTGNDMAVLTSEFISDYKNGLMRSKLRAMGLRNLLIDVKLDMIP
jgi:hypothetical protein